MNKCKKCGAEFEGKFCPSCGEPFLGEGEKLCLKCRAVLKSDTKFCPECGFSFEEKPSLPSGVRILSAVFSALPAVLLGLFSALMFLFFLAPAAIMPGGEFMGVKIPSTSYGNVYQNSNFMGFSFTGTLTALIICAAVALFTAFIVAIANAFAKLRYKRIRSAFGKMFLRTALTVLGYEVFIVLAVIAGILIGQIVKEDGGLEMIKAGAAPILVLVFCILGIFISAASAAAEKMLFKKYPALAEELEEKVKAAKPTAFETWLKKHKALTAGIAAVLAVAIAVGVGVPVGIANRHNGTYYAYNEITDEYDTGRFYKLKGNTWEDEDGSKGKITFKGETVTLSDLPEGGSGIFGDHAEEDEGRKGSIVGDVLNVEGAIFTKKGHEHVSSDKRSVCPCGHVFLATELKEDGTYMITGRGEFSGKELIIPDCYLGIPVTEIAEDAFNPSFANRGGFKSVKIGNNVVSIGKGAFNGQTGLNDIIFGDRVTSIGEGAFSMCLSLKRIVIPESVTTIGSGAFASCSSLASITIPDGIVTISSTAFASTAYYNDESNWENGNVLYIGSYLIKAKDTISSAYTVRAGTKAIADRAFYMCSSLTSVTIPDGVAAIKGWTFDGCTSLANVTIPDSVTSIEERAFLDCTGLTDIQFKGTVAEWQTIEKGNEWNKYTGNYTVTCTDGTVTKNGTVAYF